MVASHSAARAKQAPAASTTEKKKRVVRTVRNVQTDRMEKLAASEARERLPEALNRVAYGGERVIIHRRGKEIAALVSLADLQLIRELEDQIDVAAAREALADDERIPWEKARRGEKKDKNG